MKRLLRLTIIISLIMVIWPHETKPKPKTVCWAQTIPNVSMYHRAPCKGLVKRIGEL